MKTRTAKPVPAGAKSNKAQAKSAKPKKVKSPPTSLPPKTATQAKGQTQLKAKNGNKHNANTNTNADTSTNNNGAKKAAKSKASTPVKATPTKVKKETPAKKASPKLTPAKKESVKKTPKKTVDKNVKATPKKTPKKGKDTDKKEAKEKVAKTPEASPSATSASTSSSPMSPPTTPPKATVKNASKTKESTPKVAAKSPTAKPKPKAVKKVAVKKNSIAKRRKSRVASLDASAKMKVLTESVFTKSTPSEPKEPKKEVKAEPVPEKEAPLTSTTPKASVKTTPKTAPKAEKVEEPKRLKEEKSTKVIAKVPKTVDKAPKGVEKAKDKLVDKKKDKKPLTTKKVLGPKKALLKKKKKLKKRRNELGDQKTEIFDTKVYRRIASLNAAAIMAATSITATSLAGKKPVDDSDSDSDPGPLTITLSPVPHQASPGQPSPKGFTIPPTSSSSLHSPHLLSHSSPFTSLPSTSASSFVPPQPTNNGSSTSFSAHSLPLPVKTKGSKKTETPENGIKKASAGLESKTSSSKQNSQHRANVEHLSSPKSAFSPCSPVREPEIIRIEFGQPAKSSTGSSRTDGSTIKVPKPKKIKVQTIHLDRPEEVKMPSSIPSSHNVHTHQPSPRQPAGSAFAQPIPTSTHQIPVQMPAPQPQPGFFQNLYPNMHMSQPPPPPPAPAPVPLGMPVNFGFSQYAMPMPFPVVYTPMASPFSFATQPHQPALLSTPFAFPRPATSTTSVFGTPHPSPFLYQNGHDPANMFRPFTAPAQPTMHAHHAAAAGLNAHHHHQAHHLPGSVPLMPGHHQQPQMPSFSRYQQPMFRTSSSIHVNVGPQNSGPSTTTSVTIEEIHDESGDVEDVSIIPIVVQAPSDDDRSSLPSGSPRKKTEKTKTKSRVANGSRPSTTTTTTTTSGKSLNDQFEGHRTSTLTPTASLSPATASLSPGGAKTNKSNNIDIGITTKTIHLPAVNGTAAATLPTTPGTKHTSARPPAANHSSPVAPPSTAKKKAAGKQQAAETAPNVIEIVLDNPSTFHRLGNHLASPVSNNGPKNGSHRATEAVIFNRNTVANANVNSVGSNGGNNGNGNGNKKEKRIYHGWSWQGEPFYREVFINNDEKTTKKCFPAIRHLEGDIIRVRDCVLLKSGTKKNDLPFVAKIAALWEAPGDEMNMSLLWYYRPEQVDVKCESVSGEIFASRHKDVNSVACIEDKCYVLTYNQWCRYKAIRRRFLNQLIIRPPALESLDPKSSRFPPLNTDPGMVFYSSRVYDYRQKRILKS